MMMFLLLKAPLIQDIRDASSHRAVTVSDKPIDNLRTYLEPALLRLALPGRCRYYLEDSRWYRFVCYDLEDKYNSVLRAKTTRK